MYHPNNEAVTTSVRGCDVLVGLNTEITGGIVNLPPASFFLPAPLGQCPHAMFTQRNWCLGPRSTPAGPAGAWRRGASTLTTLALQIRVALIGAGNGAPGIPTGRWAPFRAPRTNPLQPRAQHLGHTPMNRQQAAHYLFPKKLRASRYDAAVKRKSISVYVEKPQAVFFMVSGVALRIRSCAGCRLFRSAQVRREPSAGPYR